MGVNQTGGADQVFAPAIFMSQQGGVVEVPTDSTDTGRAIERFLDEGGGRPPLRGVPPARPNPNYDPEVDRFVNEGGRSLERRGFRSSLAFFGTIIGSILPDMWPTPSIPEGWGLGGLSEFPDLNIAKYNSLGFLSGLECFAASCAFFALGKGNISPAQARTAGILAMVGLFGTTVFATGTLEGAGLTSSGSAPRPTRPVLPGAMPARPSNGDPLDDSDIYVNGGPNPAWEVQTSKRTALQLATNLTLATGCLLGACLLITRPQLAGKLFSFARQA